MVMYGFYWMAKKKIEKMIIYESIWCLVPKQYDITRLTLHQKLAE
jgi:hypothetical protein